MKTPTVKSNLREIEDALAKYEPFVGHSSYATLNEGVYSVYTGGRVIFTKILEGTYKGKYSFNWLPVYLPPTGRMQDLIKKVYGLEPNEEAQFTDDLIHA